VSTLGSTSEPTTGAVYFGLNSTNHHAIKLTMPSGGPWEISRVGAWCAGMNETANVKVCVWNSGGTLLGSTSTFSLAGSALAIGNSVKAEGDLTSPVTVDGGDVIYCGIARDPADNTQFSTRSGTRYDKTSASWPASMSGSASVSGAIGAYLADYHSANVAPSAPTGLNPTGDERVDTGRTITYSGTRSDPDSGDTLTGYELEVWSDGHGAKLYTTGAVTASGTTFSTARTLPSGYNAGSAYYEWRARTKDSGGLWGAWSAYQRFRPNSVPTTPPYPTVEYDSLAPLITGTFSDPDPGNVPSQAEIHVERTDTGADMWLSGAFAISTSPWSRTYAGSALAWGVQYRFRYRTRDALGGWSAWGAYRTITLVQPLGPSAMSPKTESPRQATLTPTLTVAHSATFRNDEIEVYAANSLTSTKLWTRPITADYGAVTSKAYTYAGSALAWGTTYYWRARIEDTSGVVSTWSALYPFRINALPTAPTIEVATDAGVPAVLNSNGSLVTTDTTPLLTAAFDDPDLGEGDTPSARSIEVRRKDTGAALAGYPVTSGTGPTHTLGTALTADTVYEVRWGYRDAAGQPAGSYTYSGWTPIKASALPTVAATGPASPIPDSTPTMTWTFSGAASKPQAGYRVLIFDRGPTGALYPDGEQEVHDSGPIAGTALSYAVPPQVLADLHDYRWELHAVDSDGLERIVT
jgi:hypothetical protein